MRSWSADRREAAASRSQIAVRSELKTPRVPLAFEFPPTSAEWVFFVSFAVILVGPLVVERLGFPGIIGVILGGLLVGPCVLGWVEREGVVESLGDLGILFLMFLAGLELDLDEFAANRRGALTFGAFTFTIPFVLGIALAAAVRLRARDRAAVRVALGVAHARRVPDRPGARPLTRSRRRHRRRWDGDDGHARALGARRRRGLRRERRTSRRQCSSRSRSASSILALFCAFVLPWVTRWVFAGVGQHRGARFLFIAVALTAAALVADRAGIEGIVGAFFAGLALNRLVPARSRLMEQIEFVGGVLLIPFFLLSTGMLIDPEEFTERRVLAIAVHLARRRVRREADRGARLQPSARPLASAGRLLFGLSLAQAAATLAAVTIGVEIGLFDTPS